MQEIDSLLHARWVIPVEPDNQVWEFHSLVIDKGRILDILPQEKARAKYRARASFELTEHALIPGLVNAHTHAAMTLLRGLADDLPLRAWLKEHIWPTEARWVSADFVHTGTLLAMAEMLKGGITCFNDMYFFPEVTARAASACGMRACLGLIAVEFPSAWAKNSDEYLAKGMALYEQYRNAGLIHTALAPHAPYTVSNEVLERIRVLADQWELRVHIHLHETAAEVKESIQQFGMRPLARLNRLGLVSASLLAVHMTQLEEAEIERIAEAGVYVIHCPESNLKLASGFCPIHKLIKHGVQVAFGTDSAASNNDLDMFGEMRTGALLAKAVAADAAALPAVQALRMATLNGAHALGIGEETGSLKPGKAADICAVHLGGIESQPVYHPISQLVYSTTRQQVTDVWIAGKQVVKDRCLTTLDEQALVEDVRSWRKRIAGLIA
jgi:Cytosine deaminase and related metal-dependent hydrolases